MESGQRNKSKAGRPPTISDVARAAGVSSMTVSRVINGDARVRPTTRARVDEAITRLNYTPNPAARSLATGGKLRAPGALVMMATPLCASFPAIRASASASRSPSP